MSVSYDNTDTELYSTDEYDGDDADVAGTEVYSADIDLRNKDGINIDIKFAEIGADSNDNLLARIYRRRESTWDGDEILQDEIEFTNDGSEDIGNIVINAEISGYGHYRLGFVRNGSTDSFDVDAQGRYWRKK